MPVRFNIAALEREMESYREWTYEMNYGLKVAERPSVLLRRRSGTTRHTSTVTRKVVWPDIQTVWNKGPISALWPE